MRLIQLILLAGFLCSLFVYLRFLRSSLRDRVGVLVVFTLVCATIIVPELTQRVATAVGVGRGTDLTFYLFIVGFVFVEVLMYSRVSKLSRALTEAVRRVAIVESEAQQRSAPEPYRFMRHARRTHR
jgi:hypothetical protein